MPTEAITERTWQILAIDHVQLAMPAGGEERARQFYVATLGLREVSKPRLLASRGGSWFTSADGRVHVHLGVEQTFRPAAKAHPAFAVRDLDALRRRILDAGGEVIEDDSLDVRRCYITDPFGNRIELVDEADGDFTVREWAGAEPDEERGA